MKPLTWAVEGRTSDYTVTLSPEGMACTCPARVEECRHIRAVRMLQRLALLDREAVEMLEALAKSQQEEPPAKPKPMSVKEKLNATFGEE